MDKEAIIEYAKKLQSSKDSGASCLSQATEFLRIYAGEKSSFYRKLEPLIAWNSDEMLKDMVSKILDGFIKFLESGMADGISIERQAQIDVVSDFLEQARTLLANKKVNPAAPTVLIGASLEEFLRTWIEEKGISLGNNNPTLDAYTRLLKEHELITKQDVKDLTAWAGLRNQAAHGHWDDVSDRQRINVMLEGINLFMRKYGRDTATSR